MSEELTNEIIHLLRLSACYVLQGHYPAYDVVKQIRKVIEELTGEPCVFDWEE